MSRWPLRVQLPVIALVVLLLSELLLGLAASVILHRSLVEQVDARLVEAAEPLTSAPRLDDLTEAGTVRPAVRRSDLPSDYVVYYRNRQGTVTRVITSEIGRAAEVPDLEADAPSPDPYTVIVTDGLAQWRALTLPVGAAGGTVTLALPLADTQSAVAQLRRVLFIVIVATSALGGLLAYAAVQRSLAPLRAAEGTAAKIAAGDLSQRVPAAHIGTEAGSLADSLNTMLERLDAAFSAQRSQEDALRAFVSDASHELRTPLAAIRGYAEMQRTESVDPVEAGSRIEANAIRMGALINDLLTLARLDEADRSSRAQERVDLGAVCLDVAQDLRAQAPARDITVNVADALGAPEVGGSAQQLRQVIANLGGNALQHTEGGTSIEIALSTTADDVVVTVRDHGTGIPREHHSKVFERFHRVDESRTRDTGGAGLGLAIVAAIVHAHGGHVEAANADGGGAVFAVTLPRLR